MPLEIVQNNIANMQVDAVVNTACSEAIIGFGIDAAIHKSAGKELLAERKKIGKIDYGEAAITPAFAMCAKYVIHTVEPIWQGGKSGEEQTLASCYKNSLSLARENACQSIAFPLIAASNNDFPKTLALQIAVREITSFLENNEMLVYLVVLDKKSFELSAKLLASVSAFIEATYTKEQILYEAERKCEYLGDFEFDSLGASVCDFSVCAEQPAESSDLNQLLENLDAGFSETLLKLIDKSGKTDPEIYKKANVDRRLFSKIRNNKNYNPSKATAIAFAFALELDVDETEDFISRAGYALSHSSKFDVIVEYFLLNKNYNVFELNEVLFAFDQPLVGA